MKISSSAVSNSLRSHGLCVAHQAPRSREFSRWKSTGVCCCFLLQGIFLTQGSNPGLLHCRQILYHPSHQGKNYLASTKTVSFLSHPSLSSPPLPSWALQNKSDIPSCLRLCLVTPPINEHRLLFQTSWVQTHLCGCVSLGESSNLSESYRTHQ